MTDSIDVRNSGDQRLPPGQIVTRKWPVLHYGRVPHVDPARWTFRIWGEVAAPVEWTWDQFQALPRRETHCDIHCVTRWSRYDNRFAGVPIGALLESVELRPGASHALVHGLPDYITNLPLEDLDRPENLLATHHDGEPLTPEHGGPVRLLVPHLYFWKSAKWVTGLEILAGDAPGFWEDNGYHMYGNPWEEQRFGRPDPARMRRGPRA